MHLDSSYFLNYMQDAADLLTKVKNSSKEIWESAIILEDTLRRGNKILWCGNGGSASDAQHLAAELVGRFEFNRKAFASIALNSDVSIITSLSNDFGFETIFARQIEAIGKTGDALVGITTSGSSKNVLNAIKAARILGIKTILLTSVKCPDENAFADKVIRVPSTSTCHIQECHIAIGQAICGYLERQLG